MTPACTRRRVKDLLACLDKLCITPTKHCNHVLWHGANVDITKRMLLAPCQGHAPAPPRALQLTLDKWQMEQVIGMLVKGLEADCLLFQSRAL